MDVEILDRRRPRNQLAGLADSFFVPDNGWLLSSYTLCDSARIGTHPPPEPETPDDLVWIDDEGNVYDYDPDAEEDAQ